ICHGCFNECESRVDMAQRLTVASSSRCRLRRGQPLRNCRVDQSGLGMVQREKLGLRFHEVGEATLKRSRYVAVYPLATTVQQALVGRILYQRVLESVSRLRRAAAAEDELACSQLVERLLKPGLWQG